MKKHSIVITAYRNETQLHRLIEVLKSDFDLYIHMDKKSSLKPEDFNDENVYAQKSNNINWGGWNHLQIILYLMKLALENSTSQYIHIISGEDYPVVNNRYIYKYMEENKGVNFVSCKNLSAYAGRAYGLKWADKIVRHYIHYRFPDLFPYRRASIFGRFMSVLIGCGQILLGVKRNRIGDFKFNELYHGLVYCSITKEAAMYALKYFEEHPEFEKGLRRCFAPEEIAFQTILYNSPFRQSIMDNNLRYSKWYKYLTLEEYEEIKKSTYLFMRKISDVSSPLIEKLKEK